MASANIVSHYGIPNLISVAADELVRRLLKDIYVKKIVKPQKYNAHLPWRSAEFSEITNQINWKPPYTGKSHNPREKSRTISSHPIPYAPKSLFQLQLPRFHLSQPLQHLRIPLPPPHKQQPKHTPPSTHTLLHHCSSCATTPYNNRRPTSSTPTNTHSLPICPPPIHTVTLSSSLRYHSACDRYHAFIENKAVS